MAEVGEKKGLWKVVAVLIVLGLLPVVYLWLNPAGPTTPADPLGGWTFLSVRSYEDSANARDETLLNAGDGLLAEGPPSDLSCYALLQDELKLEQEYSPTQDSDVGHGLKKVAGIRLSAGDGRVRIVAICADEPLPQLSEGLAAASSGNGTPDGRLITLRTWLNGALEADKVKIYPSRWYRLTRTPLGPPAYAPKPAGVPTGQGMQPPAGPPSPSAN